MEYLPTQSGRFSHSTFSCSSVPQSDPRSAPVTSEQVRFLVLTPPLQSWSQLPHAVHSEYRATAETYMTWNKPLHFLMRLIMSIYMTCIFHVTVRTCKKNHNTEMFRLEIWRNFLKTFYQHSTMFINTWKNYQPHELVYQQQNSHYNAMHSPYWQVSPV